MVDHTIKVAGPAGKLGDILKGQITQILDKNPVAAKAFKEIHDAGIEIVLDTTPKPPEHFLGLTPYIESTGQATEVIIYVNNVPGPIIAAKIVGIIAHESKHVQMGTKFNTLYEEYFAHIREALYKNGGRIAPIRAAQAPVGELLHAALPALLRRIALRAEKDSTWRR